MFRLTEQKSWEVNVGNNRDVHQVSMHSGRRIGVKNALAILAYEKMALFA